MTLHRNFKKFFKPEESRNGGVEWLEGLSSETSSQDNPAGEKRHSESDNQLKLNNPYE